jgi:hypothetical protein
VNIEVGKQEDGIFTNQSNVLTLKFRKRIRCLPPSCPLSRGLPGMAIEVCNELQKQHANLLIEVKRHV